jgi:hypothetical protein
MAPTYLYVGDSLIPDKAAHRPERAPEDFGGVFDGEQKRGMYINMVFHRRLWEVRTPILAGVLRLATVRNNTVS